MKINKNSWFSVATALLLLLWLVIPAHANSMLINVTIPVRVVTQSVPKPKTDVRFTLEAIDGAPIGSGNECIVGVDSEGLFPAITFMAPGTYTYRVRAQSLDPSAGTLKGITDYRVQIIVSYDNGTVKAAMVASDWLAPASQEPKEPIVVEIDSAQNPNNPSDNGNNNGNGNNGNGSGINGSGNGQNGNSSNNGTSTSGNANTSAKARNRQMWGYLAAGSALFILVYIGSNRMGNKEE